MELKWKRIIRCLRADARSIMIEDEELKEDYIRYAVAVEQTLRVLEAGLQ